MKTKRAFLLLAVAVMPEAVFGSCGSAFCSVNTGFEARGVWTGPGTRVDLRYEYIDQNQLRSGTSKVSPEGEPGTHDELSTLNRNWLLQVDHSVDSHWGGTLIVPYVQRDHQHLFNPEATEPQEEAELESWRIREMGDVRLIGRYQIAADIESGRAYGVRFGLKLPTGRYEVRNDAGEQAERSLQPGTGTTDLILGAYYRGPLLDRSDWFASAYIQSALNSRQEFRPGTQFALDAGVSVPLAAALSAQVQLNFLERWHDTGAQAEPQDSGGTFLFLSPGVSLALSQRWTLYAFAQLPLYQRVDGTQLTARSGGVVGANVTF
jgi:hypothetical protein